MSQTDENTTRLICPKCQSHKIARLPRAQYRHVHFMIRAPRRCLDCNHLFEPPCGPLPAIVTIMVGLVALACTGETIIGSIRGFLSGTGLFSALVKLLLGPFMARVSLIIIQAGWRGLREPHGARDWSPETAPKRSSGQPA